MLASRKDITKLPGRGGLSPVSGRASSNTRSNGTVARSLPESKEICATRAALSKSPEATGTVIGTNPVNQPVVLSSVGVLRVSVVVTTSNVSQLVNSRSARAAQAKTPPLKRAPPGPVPPPAPLPPRQQQQMRSAGPTWARAPTRRCRWSGVCYPKGRSTSHKVHDLRWRFAVGGVKGVEVFDDGGCCWPTNPLLLTPIHREGPGWRLGAPGGAARWRPSSSVN